MRHLAPRPLRHEHSNRLRALVACLVMELAVLVVPSAKAAENAPSVPQVTVDALSVVKVRSTAVANARSSGTLGQQREGTGVVIDSKGLVMTIGYLIT